MTRMAGLPCDIHAPVITETLQDDNAQYSFSTKGSDDILSSTDDHRRELLEAWYAHFGDRPTPLANILDPSNKVC